MKSRWKSLDTFLCLFVLSQLTLSSFRIPTHFSQDRFWSVDKSRFGWCCCLAVYFVQVSSFGDMKWITWFWSIAFLKMMRLFDFIYNNNTINLLLISLLLVSSEKWSTAPMRCAHGSAQSNLFHLFSTEASLKEAIILLPGFRWKLE